MQNDKGNISDICVRLKQMAPMDELKAVNVIILWLLCDAELPAVVCDKKYGAWCKAGVDVVKVLIFHLDLVNVLRVRLWVIVADTSNTRRCVASNAPSSSARD